MTDLRLVNIIPPSGVPQPQTPLGVGSQGVPNPPPLINGTVLSGFIVNRDAAGNPILRTTDRGDIPFSTQFFLKIGSEVVLRIEGRIGQTQARILTVNGLPPEVATANTQASDDGDVIVTSTNRGNNTQASSDTTRTPATNIPTSTTQSSRTVAPSSPSTVNASPVIRGTLIAQPLPTQNPSSPAPTLTLGTQLNFNLANVLPAGSDDAEFLAQFFTAPSNTPSSKPSSSTAVPTTVAAPSAPTTNAPSLPIASPTTPNTTSAASPTASDTSVQATLTPGQTITATVVSKEPSGALILNTALGLVRVEQSIDLPLGSRLTLTLNHTAPPLYTPPSAGASEPAATLPQLAQLWSSLGQIVSLLQDGSDLALSLPSLLAQPSGATTPSAASLSSGLLFFLAALKGGDIRTWLGENNSRKLEEKGFGDLIQKAGREFGLIGRQYEQAQPGHWQSLFFPVMVDGNIQQVRFFTKRDRKQDNQTDAKEEDTRFIVEVDLSQLGEMQLDGFVRPTRNNLQFDLVIRTHQPLDKTFQNELISLYNHLGELTGYQGSLQFAVSPDFPTRPIEEILGSDHRNVVA